MQDLDNNMDELFRKAADGYPLKTDATGWDNVKPLLLETPALLNIPNIKKRQIKYSVLIILLLTFFLFGTLTSRYIWKNDSVVAGRLKSPVLPVNNAATKKLQTIPTLNQSLNMQPKSGSKGQLISKRAGANATFIIADPNKIILSTLLDDLDEERNATQLETTQQSRLVKSIATLTIEKHHWPDVEVIKMNNDTVSNKVAMPSIKEDVENIHATTNGAPIITNTINEKSNQPLSKFYLGAIAGVSFNRVKNQGLQKPGYDIGLMAGYQFTKQLSIETGLLFEQKYYYTSGEYFNISKITSTMPVDMKIVSLKGSFSVFELPLTVKYNLPGNNTHGHFYTTARISTYLISKEYNQYKTLLNGTQNNMTGTYNNQSTFSPASLTISIGYEKTIGKSVLMRVDPYFQIPLKGLGVGALPVTTVGVHLGVFRFKK